MNVSPVPRHVPSSMVVRTLAGVCLAITLAAAGGCREDEGGVRVTRLRFTGLNAVSAEQLESVLATGASSRLPWGERRYFRREQFEADMKRIVAFYHDRGYPDARVTSFDVDLSRDQTSVALTVDISEGEPVVAERVELAGFEALTEEDRAALERRLPLGPGQPMDRALIQASREAALDQLRELGYAYASVRVVEEPGSGARQRIIRLTAEPGPQARYGAVEIVGNSSVDDTVISRQLTFRPGDIFRQSRLVESQRRLYGLEVFRFANIQPVREEEGQTIVEIPTRVTVTEGDHRRVNFSAGYGTEERARVEVDWRHVNFFGGARTAGVLGRYSSLDRGVRLNFHEPYLFHPRYSFGLQGQGWYTREPLFSLNTVGGRLTVNRQFGAGRAAPHRGTRAATTLAFTYANEWEEYAIENEALEDPELRDYLISLRLDPRCGIGPRCNIGAGRRSFVGLEGARNTTDNILDAKRGYFASVRLEQSGAWLGGDFDYYEVTAEGRYYLALGDLAVVAVLARAGSIDALRGVPAGEGAVPFYKRYFLGGATNLRGWGRFEVAPLSGAGLPLGGHTMLNFSTELRFPVWSQLGGVIFLDGGNVWSDPWSFRVNDMRYNVGPGLRYNTPIGPIRADIGYQLNPIPELRIKGEPQPRRFRFHFSIGQAF